MRQNTAKGRKFLEELNLNPENNLILGIDTEKQNIIGIAPTKREEVFALIDSLLLNVQKKKKYKKEVCIAIIYENDEDITIAFIEKDKKSGNYMKTLFSPALTRSDLNKVIKESTHWMLFFKKADGRYIAVSKN